MTATQLALAALAAVDPGIRVWGPEGAIGTVVGIRGAARGAPRAAGGFVLVRLSSFLGLRHSTHLVPADWIRAEPATRAGGTMGVRADGARAHERYLTLDATRRQVAGCTRVRPDAHIRADVRRALDEARLTRGGASLYASVSEGVVQVEGHTPGEDGMRRAVECAARVPGVLAVVDRAAREGAAA